MIMDFENLFSNDQAITVAAASTNIIDLGALGMGKGDRPVDVLVQVTAKMGNTETDGTVLVALQSDTTAAFSSPTVVCQTAAIAEATLVAGYQFSLSFIPVNTEQFVRLYFTIGGTGTELDNGTVTAALILDRQTNS